jgi:hypothetical protein
VIEEFDRIRDRGRGWRNEERERESNKLLSSRVIMNKTVGRSKLKKKKKNVRKSCSFSAHQSTLFFEYLRTTTTTT